MLAQSIESISNYLEHILLIADIPGIVLIAFLENVFPPTPSEFLYPLAGKLAYEGKLNLLVVMLAGATGSMIGAFIFYHLGYYLGTERVRNFIERYGTVKFWHLQISFFSVKTYNDSMVAFEKRGAIIVMIARTMPLIHGVISIPAGVNRMNLAKFMFYSFIGALLWIIPTVLLGYFMGSQWEFMLNLIASYETLCYILLASLLIYYVIKRWRNHLNQTLPIRKG